LGGRGTASASNLLIRCLIGGVTEKGGEEFRRRKKKLRRAEQRFGRLGGGDARTEGVKREKKNLEGAVVLRGRGGEKKKFLMKEGLCVPVKVARYLSKGKEKVGERSIIRENQQKEEDEKKGSPTISPERTTLGSREEKKREKLFPKRKSLLP